MIETKTNIAREVAALRQMTVKELRGRYLEVFGEAARSGNKDWLWKRIAWRIQANAEGDLTERARRRAEELANDADLRMRRPPDPPPRDSGRMWPVTPSSHVPAHRLCRHTAASSRLAIAAGCCILVMRRAMR